MAWCPVFILAQMESLEANNKKEVLSLFSCEVLLCSVVVFLFFRKIFVQTTVVMYYFYSEKIFLLLLFFRILFSQYFLSSLSQPVYFVSFCFSDLRETN